MLPPKFYSQAKGKARLLRLHKHMKNGEADDNGLGEKEDGVELMIALVARDRSRRQAREKKQVTDDVLRPQLKKMRDAFKQRVNDIDRRKQSEEDEESAMVRVKMRLVVNGKIDIAFSRKK